MPFIVKNAYFQWSVPTAFDFAVIGQLFSYMAQKGALANTFST